MYCRYKDQEMRINLQLTAVYHALCRELWPLWGYGIVWATIASLDFVALQNLDHNVA